MRGRLVVDCLWFVLTDESGRLPLVLMLESTCVCRPWIFSSMHLSRSDCFCLMLRISLCVAFVCWNIRSSFSLDGVDEVVVDRELFGRDE